MANDDLQISMSVNIEKDNVIKFVNEYLTKECADRVEAVVGSYQLKNKIIPEMVKDMVYSHKEEIINRIVDRAVTELVKKGLPKLLERMDVECSS